MRTVSKDSGIGRELSPEGVIANFAQTKQINVRLGSDQMLRGLSLRLDLVIAGG